MIYNIKIIHTPHKYFLKCSNLKIVVILRSNNSKEEIVFPYLIMKTLIQQKITYFVLFCITSWMASNWNKSELFMSFVLKWGFWHHTDEILSAKFDLTFGASRIKVETCNSWVVKSTTLKQNALTCLPSNTMPLIFVRLFCVKWLQC